MKAIIFDLDGTLYDNSHLPIRLILHSLPHIFTLSAERKSRAELSGKHFGSREEYFHQLFSRIAQKRGITEQKAELWYRGIYMPSMRKVLTRHYHYKASVPEILQQLRSQNIKIAVFSDYGYLDQRLKAVDINPEWFDLCVDAPALGGLKPCRESFLKIAEMLNEAPEDILVIGDRDDTDGQGARNSGMQFLLVKKKDPFFKDIKEIIK